MLGLLLIYFVGKAFYDLAQEHRKSRWGFAILGIVAYYAGTFIAGIFITILAELQVTDFFNDLPELALGFIALPFGILACWAFYRILENHWGNQPKGNNSETLDGDLMKP